MLHLFVEFTGKTTVDSEAGTNLTVSNYDLKSSAKTCLYTAVEEINSLMQQHIRTASTTTFREYNFGGLLYLG